MHSRTEKRLGILAAMALTAAAVGMPAHMTQFAQIETSDPIRLASATPIHNNATMLADGYMVRTAPVR